MLSQLVTVVTEELDPAATRPSPLSLIIFLFLAASLALLIFSMLRHMRTARNNLGPQGSQVPPQPDAGPGSGRDPGRANGPASQPPAGDKSD